MSLTREVQRLKICQVLLNSYRNEGDGFLRLPFWDAKRPILEHYQMRGSTTKSVRYNEMVGTS
jgi:hypothetical protein